MDRINSGSRRDLSAVHMLSQTVYIYSILPTPNINLEGLKKRLKWRRIPTSFTSLPYKHTRADTAIRVDFIDAPAIVQTWWWVTLVDFCTRRETRVYCWLSVIVTPHADCWYAVTIACLPSESVYLHICDMGQCKLKRVFDGTNISRKSHVQHLCLAVTFLFTSLCSIHMSAHFLCFTNNQSCLGNFASQ